MKKRLALLLSLGLTVPCLATPPTVKVRLWDQVLEQPPTPALARQVPHGCFAYLDTETSDGDPASTVGAGDWHDCNITWSVTKLDGTPIGQTITLTDPRPQAPGGSIDTRTGQKGYVAWYLFEEVRSYKFTATVTNRDGEVGSGSISLNIVADARTYYHVDSTAPSGGDGTIQNPFNTWLAATQAIGSGNADKGILLKAGQTFQVNQEWLYTQPGNRNFRLDTYGGTAPATLNWTTPDTTPHNFIDFQHTRNVLVRNISLTRDDSTQVEEHIGGIAIGQGCYGVSVVNCTASRMQVGWSASQNNLPSAATRW